MSVAVCIVPVQQFVRCRSERLTDIDQLDIRYKPFTAFDPLYGVFIDVQSEDLQSVGESSLRIPEFLSPRSKSGADQIIRSVVRLIDKQAPYLRKMTFTRCQTNRKSMIEAGTTCRTAAFRG